MRSHFPHRSNRTCSRGKSGRAEPRRRNGGDNHIFEQSNTLNGRRVPLALPRADREWHWYRCWTRPAPPTPKLTSGEALHRCRGVVISPYSFRKTLTQLGERIRRAPEEVQGVEPHLGNATKSIFGSVAVIRQSVIIRGIFGRQWSNRHQATCHAT